MMARFISKLTRTEDHVHDDNYQYDEFDEESEKNDHTNVREADLSKNLIK